MKVKGFLLIAIILVGSLSAFSQERAADSLKALLKTAPHDSSRVILLLSLSDYYLSTSPAPEQARQFGIQALELADDIRYLPGKALALKSIASAYYFMGNTPLALEYFGNALHIYDSTKDIEGQARIYNNFGTVYYMNGSADKALDNYIKELDLAEKINDTAGIAAAYINLGNVYNMNKATTYKAVGYYTKALLLSEAIGDKNNLGAVSVNLGEIYINLGKYDSALYFFDKSLVAYGKSINTPYPLRDKGRVFAERGDYVNAINYVSQSFSLAQQYDSKLDMTQSQKQLGDIYYKKGDFQAALIAYKLADSIAAAIPANKELDEAYEGLANTYSKVGDYTQAFKYQRLFSALADTLNNLALADKLTSLQRNFEIQTRQNEINLLTKDKALQDLDLRRQKIQKAFITAGLVLIFIIAFIIYRNYRAKAKTNVILDRQKAEIEGLLLNILPGEVAEELQRTGSSAPRYFEHVSVLFTDFKGFTKLADAMSPQEVVSVLNSCFMAFDAIMEKYHLEKIKTIGDSYMCAGGIPTPNAEHPINIIKAAMEIRDCMYALNTQRRELGQPTWELRIGIHIGPVVAGVVGRKKYAYDIWGSTVNIASRMESNGEPGQINISAAAYEMVKHKYHCTYRGKISAKNIGEIDMYFVNGEILEPSASPVEMTAGEVSPSAFLTQPEEASQV